MRVCIDTNVYSSLKKGNLDVIELLENANEVYVPAIVLGELYAGFQMGNKLKNNTKELKEFLDEPGVYIIDIDIYDAIAERYGLLIKILKKNGTPIPTNDIWIAATTLEKGAKIATFDAHFKVIPGLINVDIN